MILENPTEIYLLNNSVFVLSWIRQYSLRLLWILRLFKFEVFLVSTFESRTKQISKFSQI